MVTIRNSNLSYGFVAKFLHWIIAFLVLFMLILGFLLDSLSHGLRADFFYDLHKSIGLSVLILMVIRLFWRMMNKVPELPFTTPGWEKLLSKTTHILFYLALILMPLDGWIMSVTSGYAPSYFGLFTLNLPIEKNKALADFMTQVHQFLAWTLIVLITVHILAALKHYLFNKDTILQRMLLPNR